MRFFVTCKSAAFGWLRGDGWDGWDAGRGDAGAEGAGGSGGGCQCFCQNLNFLLITFVAVK